jgi:IS30 family transposase
MGMAEKIRILLIKRGNMSEAELARKLNKTPQSFNSSMKRDNFTEKDLKEIAKALNCEYKSTFVITETGEEI